MAQINEDKFVKKERERYTIHDKIDSTYSIFNKDGEKYFQIDMYGRSSREMPGKISQSIQFDKVIAKKIVEILKKEYNL
jgi:hypothetical protein